MFVRQIFVTFVFILFFQAAQANSLEGLINSAKSLLAKQSFQEAYQMLSENEASYGGEFAFDYYLGFSALQAGKPAEAVFALERALAVKPNSQQAQADLGRAYYYLGENKAAKEQFEKVKTNNDVPTGVTSTIDKFLSAIQQRFDSSGSRLSYFIEGGIGSDSNVNSSSNLEEANFVLLGVPITVEIPDESRETDSTFFEIKPGLRYINPLKDDLNLYASTDIQFRQTPDASEFSTRIFNGLLGLGFLRGSSQYRSSLSFQNYAVDGDDLRDQIAFNFEWHKSLNAQNRFVSFLQLADISYDEALSTRDGGQDSLGFNWLRSVGSSLYYAGFFLGSENIDESTQSFNERDFVGLKVGGQWPVKGHSLLANVTLQSSDYADLNPSIPLTEVRDDSYSSLEIAYQINFSRDLVVIPKISFVQNDSNIEINDYERSIVGVYAKYKF